MPNKDFLKWPFFETYHRTMASELESWARAELTNILEEDEYLTARLIVKKLADAGWLKYAVPASCGGVLEKLDVRSLCIIRETLARHSGLADFSFAMQGLGSGPISLFGTDAQKRSWLPAVMDGKAIAAFALSEPQAGSDVAAIETSARLDGDNYILNGEKTWISNAGIAAFYVVFARTAETPGSKGLSAFIVPADASGLTVSDRIKVTSPHPLGTLEFSECKVPATAMLGGPGEGFKIAMATLDVFRSTVGAAALGFARRALYEAINWTRERQVSGRPLSEYQLTQQKIADMATEIDASALLIYRSAWTKDVVGGRVTREAAMAKMYATEAAQRVIDSAMQLLGGAGVVADSPVERLYRDIRPLRIYEGTTEIQKLIISAQTYAAFESKFS